MNGTAQIDQTYLWAWALASTPQSCRWDYWWQPQKHDQSRPVQFEFLYPVLAEAVDSGPQWVYHRILSNPILCPVHFFQCRLVSHSKSVWDGWRLLRRRNIQIRWGSNRWTTKHGSLVAYRLTKRERKKESHRTVSLVFVAQTLVPG